MLDKLTSLVSRVFVALAIILCAVAVISWLMQNFGWRFTWLDYKPGRLFEFAAMAMTIVIALLLRQIRDALRK